MTDGRTTDGRTDGHQNGQTSACQNVNSAEHPNGCFDYNVLAQKQSQRLFSLKYMISRKDPAEGESQWYKVFAEGSRGRTSRKDRGRMHVCFSSKTIFFGAACSCKSFRGRIFRTSSRKENPNGIRYSRKDLAEGSAEGSRGRIAEGSAEGLRKDGRGRKKDCS